MNANQACPIWKTQLSVPRSGYPQVCVDSPRAGGCYRITWEAELNLGVNDELEKARLTSWLVEQRQMGEECPEVTANVVEDAIRRPRLSVHERADRLLRGIRSGLADIASTFYHDPNEDHRDVQYTLAWSESIRPEEVKYLLDYLQSRDWIERTNRDAHGILPEYRVSIGGHARLAELEEITQESSKAFVAMWFHESTNDVWETAIQPGIENAGYEPDRIDRKEHLNKIDDEIIAGLRRARFVVADFTHGDDGARGGVYYEAGFAHGRNIPVIFTCRKDVFEKVHFDTRQYNHIVWEGEKLNEFRSKLTQRICAVIGDGPRKT